MDQPTLVEGARYRELLVLMIKPNARALVMALPEIREEIAYDIMRLIFQVAGCNVNLIDEYRNLPPDNIKFYLEDLDCITRKSWKSRTLAYLKRFFSLRHFSRTRKRDETYSRRLIEVVTRNPLSCLIFFLQTFPIPFLRRIIRRFYVKFGEYTAYRDLVALQRIVNETLSAIQREEIGILGWAYHSTVRNMIIQRLTHMNQHIDAFKLLLYGSDEYNANKIKFKDHEKRLRDEKAQEDLQKLLVEERALQVGERKDLKDVLRREKEVLVESLTHQARKAKKEADLAEEEKPQQHWVTVKQVVDGA